MQESCPFQNFENISYHRHYFFASSQEPASQPGLFVILDLRTNMLPDTQQPPVISRRSGDIPNETAVCWKLPAAGILFSIHKLDDPTVA